MKDAPPVLLKALELYCEWLNMWQDHERPTAGPHTYSPALFLEWDPNNGKWGQWSDGGHLAGYYEIHMFTITDGDDGGPTELTIYWDGEEVRHIIQTFDTYTQSIYDTTVEGPKFLRTP